jgi:hypothetical protein
MKYFLLTISIFLIPFYAWSEQPAAGPDLTTAGAEDTTEVYNLLDTLSLELGIEQSGERLNEEKSLKDDLLDLLYGAIFRDTTYHNPDYKDDLVESEERFRMYAGKTIAGIFLKKIPVFGGSVDDSLSMAISDIDKFGNSLHVNTQDRVIYNNLLFKKGDQIKPFTLADNERILRQLPFIRDARILVVPRKDGQEVDVIILTRDVFSIGANLRIHGEDDIAVSIFDRNLFGNGWEFRNTFRNRSERTPSLGYEGVFDVRNIGGSFIAATLRYSQAFDMLQGRVAFAKEYLTQETRYAGGLDYAHTTVNDESNHFDTVLYSSDLFDLWIGRSFVIGDIENRNVFKLGVRYFQTIFEDRPLVFADSNFAYHNQKILLGNIIFNNLRYYTSSMVLGFGQTEDISQGYALEYTAGYGQEEFKERFYNGVQFWLASWIEHLGYFAFTSQASAFVNRMKAEDGILKFRLNYFSPLMHIDSYKFRHFFYVQYVKGFNRKNDRLIDIQNDNGIRGLSQEGLSGNEKLVITFESRIFTPWALSGFRFTLLPFADFGFIGNENNLLNVHDLYSALGLGCQIRNEALVLQTVNLRVAYYPRVPGGNSQFGFKITLSEPVLFSQVRLGKPRIFLFE